MKNKFKFSVVMPIYNIELYLEEAIESVVNQSIGFKDNIQLILVNDGSTDSSEEICLKYCRLYPNNVKYFKQSNKGVSSARNAGSSFVLGKYTNFFDGDDVWDQNAFELVYDMFEKNYNSIDLIACRQKYFEKKKSYQALDFKFENGNQVVDINEHPNYLQMSVTSCFIKSSVLKEYSFDENLKYAEDAKYLTQLILSKEKYGLLKDTIYHIRKRNNDSSATQNKLDLITSYTDTVNLYYKYIYDYSIKKYKKLHPYVEYALINALKYRVGSKIPDRIPKKVKDKYIQDILSLVEKISDEAIINTGKINIDTRLYLLSIKNNGIDNKEISYKDGYINYKNNAIMPLNTNSSLYIEKFEINNNICYIKGILKTSLYIDVKNIYIDMVGKKYCANLKENKEKERLSFNGEQMNKVYDFSMKIKLDKNDSRLMFYYIYENNQIILKINLKEGVKTNKISGSFFKYKLCKINKTKLIINSINFKFLLKKIKKEMKKCF